MTTLTRKNTRSKNKSPEITRLETVMNALGLEAIDIARKTGVSERTITGFIFNDTPIGGRLLRELHAKYGVSIDWLLSGEGSMFINRCMNEPVATYEATPHKNVRAQRLSAFIQRFMASATPDEQAWLEMHFKFTVPQYQQFLLQGPRHE